jgi:hypothetical protein
MKHDASHSRHRSLTDELADLDQLDSTALKQRWRLLYGTRAPVRIGRALLLQAVAYRVQEKALGGLKPSTRRLLERAARRRRAENGCLDAPASSQTGYGVDTRVARG